MFDISTAFVANSFHEPALRTAQRDAGIDFVASVRLKSTTRAVTRPFTTRLSRILRTSTCGVRGDAQYGVVVLSTQTLPTVGTATNLRTCPTLARWTGVPARFVITTRTFVGADGVAAPTPAPPAAVTASSDAAVKSFTGILVKIEVSRPARAAVNRRRSDATVSGDIPNAGPACGPAAWQ